jgi:ankyrin repeat protein
VEISCSSFTTPKVHTAIETDNTELALELIASKEGIKSRDGSGATPLMRAASLGQIEVMKALIEAGAEVNKRNQSWTPIMYAAWKGQTEAAKILIEKGALVNSPNKYGGTPLYVALDWGHVDTAFLFIQNGAELSVKEIEKQTLLMVAAKAGSAKLIRLLVENGANVNAANKYLSTPLIYAAKGDDRETVEVLIEKGADIHHRNASKNTPLFVAALNGNKEPAEVLIEYGADINVKCRKNWTPLQAAGYNNHLEIIELLLDNGANQQIIEKGAHNIYAAATIQKMLAKRAKKEGNSDKAMEHYLNAAERFDKAAPAYIKLAKSAGTKALLKSIIGAAWSVADLAHLQKTGSTSIVSSQGFDWTTPDLSKFKKQCKTREEMSKKLATECRQLAEDLKKQ